MTADIIPIRTEPRSSLTEFARQVERSDAEVRAAEIGLRAHHAELVEQRSPRTVIARRAAQADPDAPRVRAPRRTR